MRFSKLALYFAIGAIGGGISNPSQVVTASNAIRESPQRLKAIIPTSTEELFSGGLSSLAVSTVGQAEGTLHYGKPNPAYYGHQDPGDGLSNKGWCSWSDARGGTQTKTPAEADQYCANTLKRRIQQVDELSTRYSVTLTFWQRLNAIDLGNQAPQALLGDEHNPGFVGLLVKFKKERPELDAENLIIEARTYSFLNYSTGKWESFRGEEGMRMDQARRYDAIKSAATQYFASRNQELPVSYNPDAEFLYLRSIFTSRGSQPQN